MDKRIRQIIIAFTMIGLLVSIYMTIFKITSNDSMCIGSRDCSVVNASKYSEVNGIPVAVVGMFGYASLLAITLLEGRPGFFQTNGTLIFFGVALMGFFFTLWLIFVEVRLLNAYCPFCITSQISMTIIFILSVTRLIRQS